ncbi:MAG: FHA domain-containing protein [Chloroflexota bacterium]
MSEQNPDKTLVNRCPNCGHHNAPGTLICANCGILLTGEKAGATYQLSEDELTAQPTEPNQRVNLNDRKMHFPEDATFAIKIREVDDPMVYQPKNETLLVGRRNKHSEFSPDVDMYTYAGFLLGVSRRHALIYVKDNRLMLEDLGSSNGTWVDGVQLKPREPELLYDGVEVSLGKLHFTVHFSVV